MSELIIFIGGALFGAVSLYIYAKMTVARLMQQHIEAVEEQEVESSPEYMIEKHDGQYMAYAAEDSRFAGQGSTLNELILLLSKNNDVLVMSDDESIVAELKSSIKG